MKKTIITAAATVTLVAAAAVTIRAKATIDSRKSRLAALVPNEGSEKKAVEDKDNGRMISIPAIRKDVTVDALMYYNGYAVDNLIDSVIVNLLYTKFSRVLEGKNSHDDIARCKNSMSALLNETKADVEDLRNFFPGLTGMLPGYIELNDAAWVEIVRESFDAYYALRNGKEGDRLVKFSFATDVFGRVIIKDRQAVKFEDYENILSTH